MGRPKASELTERELEIMHVFWEGGERTIADVQKQLEQTGRELAYTTVATLVRILLEKSFIEQTTSKRPHAFKAVRSHEEVSGSLLRDLMQKVFGGSAEALVMRLMEDETLSKSERKRLQDLLNQTKTNKDSSKR